MNVRWNFTTLSAKHFRRICDATPVAAMKEIGGRLEKGAVVVCIATGNGLKDQETVTMDLDKSPTVSDAQGLVGLLGRLAG